MLDIEVLKCEFVSLVYFWTGKLQWGIDCDTTYLQELSEEFYNGIQIIENISECDIDPIVWDNLRATIEKIREAGVVNFCNNC